MEGIRRPISARSVDRGDHHSADDAPGGLAGVELGIRLLVDHREPFVRMRTALYSDLLWHLHDLRLEQTFPGCALDDRLSVATW
jgi:hypothetical protein